MDLSGNKAAKMQIDTQTKTILSIIIFDFFGGAESGCPIFSLNKSNEDTNKLTKNRHQVYCNLRSILYSVCDILS